MQCQRFMRNGGQMKGIFPALVLALTAAGITACGGNNTTTVTPTATPTATETTASLQSWAGTWLDDQEPSGTEYTIRLINGEPKFTSGRYENEDVTVMGSSWDGSRLSFSYKSPQGVAVTLSNCSLIEQDRMKCSWHNDQGKSGTDDQIIRS